jgi:hypothetical protein
MVKVFDKISLQPRNWDQGKWKAMTATDSPGAVRRIADDVECRSQVRLLHE